MIGVDFEDLRTVMSERGTAMMGSAIASGPDRARIAAENAVACPLLEGVTLNGARGVLVYITASEETMKMKETKTVMNIITNFTAKGAQVIYGSAYDDSMGDSMRVTVVATGLDGGKDKEVPALDKVDQEVEVLMPNTRSSAQPLKPTEPDPWAAPRAAASQPAAPKVEEPFEQVQEEKPEEKAPEQLAEPEVKEEEKKEEEKTASEWEGGWWSIRHDKK